MTTDELRERYAKAWTNPKTGVVSDIGAVFDDAITELEARDREIAELRTERDRLQAKIDRVVTFLAEKKRTQIEIGLPHNPELDREIAALTQREGGEG